MVAPSLTARERFALILQREVGRLLAPIWVPLCCAMMRWRFAWRIAGAREVRREYRRLLRGSSAPLLVCANHLTLVDSFLIGWALGSPWWYVWHFRALPWNTPERTNFAATRWSRALVYLMKCVPISRGSERREVARVIDRFTWLLSRGEVGLIFPEGGRSRTGRVQVESAAYGVGRIVKALPGCRVLCVYLRAEGQETWSDFPPTPGRFHLELSSFEPKSDHGGLRGSLDIARQIVARLADMEGRYFDDRQ